MLNRVGFVKVVSLIACATSVGAQQSSKQSCVTSGNSKKNLKQVEDCEGMKCLSNQLFKHQAWVVETNNEFKEFKKRRSAEFILRFHTFEVITKVEQAFNRLNNSIKREDREFNRNTSKALSGTPSINKARLEQLMIKKDNIAELLELITPDDIVRGTFDGDEIKRKIADFCKGRRSTEISNVLLKDDGSFSLGIPQSRQILDYLRKELDKMHQVFLVETAKEKK